MVLSIEKAKKDLKKCFVTQDNLMKAIKDKRVYDSIDYLSLPYIDTTERNLMHWIKNKENSLYVNMILNKFNKKDYDLKTTIQQAQFMKNRDIFRKAVEEIKKK